MSGRTKKKKKRWRGMSILRDIQNLPGQDQKQCDLPPELALTSSWPHFEWEVGPETSEGTF